MTDKYTPTFPPTRSSDQEMNDLVHWVFTELTRIGASTAPSTATVWVNFTGTGTVTIKDNLGVSSITDNGTGNYTVNFKEDLTNTGYTAVATSTQPISYVANISSTSIDVLTESAVGTPADATTVNLVIFGE